MQKTQYYNMINICANQFLVIMQILEVNSIICLGFLQYLQFLIIITKNWMDEFKRCQSQLKKLIMQNILPINMQRKLKYMESLILNKHNQEAYKDLLPDFQRSSLDQMNKDTQKAFFINIINCFSASRQKQHFKDIKVNLKKKQGLDKKANLYLSCIGNTLSVANKKDRIDLQQQFHIENIQNVSNRFDNGFTIGYEGAQYQITFQDKSTCQKIHKNIQDIIQQNNSQQSQGQKREQIGNNLIEQQIQHLKSLKKIIQKQLMYEDKFKLIRNIPNGKIQVNQVNNSARMLLFVQHCQITQYIESFLMLDGWNTQIETFKIIKQIRKNTYLAFIKLKKYNLWTSQRYAYITISYLKGCNCFADEKDNNQKSINKYYVLIKSVDYHQQSHANAVKMDFSQIATFCQMKDMGNKIFISLVSNIDYKSYQFLANKGETNMNMLKDVPSISILYKQRIIHKNNIKYIQFDHCACTINKKYYIINLPLQNKQQENSIHQSIAQIKPKEISYQTNQTISIIKDQINNIKNEKILQIIKKKLYQSYYLRLKFQLACKQAPYIQSKYSLNSDRNYLLQNGKWQISKNDEYIFVDQNELKIQKGVLRLIIKQITSNILAGKSVMSMSLPVQIFDTISTLQGVVGILGFLPKYLHDATSTTDIVQQIKNVGAAFIFLFACHPKICKPFNPILGQTFQAVIGGIPIFVEQISHHPPISAFYMKNDKFEAYGNFDLHVDLGLNAAYSKTYGVYHVKIFETNTQFMIKYPDLQIGGIMFGDRSLKPKGKGYILQKNNNIYLEYSIGKDKKKIYQYQTKLKSSDLAGGIFKVNKQFANKIINQDKKKPTEGIKFEDMEHKYCQISGKWYGNLYFDCIEYKSIDKGAFPLIPQRPLVLLPSDTLFREDIIYKKWGDNKRSNQQKQALQNLQRRDRKLRDKSLK